jgi:putative addiction module component (TIGR02574 family)
MFLRNGQLEKGGNVIAKELQAQILSLNSIGLVEMLLESLDKTDPEIEAAWVAESERKYAAYRRGIIQGSTLEEVKKRMLH